MRDARHIRPLANVKVVFHVPCKCVVVKPVDKLFEIICIHIGADEGAGARRPAARPARLSPHGDKARKARSVLMWS